MPNAEGPKQLLFPGIRPASVEVRRLMRLIDECRNRSLAKCDAIDLPNNDTRRNGVIYRADSAIAWGRQWEPGTEPSPLGFLRDTQRQLLLRELALSQESLEPGEQPLDTMRRMDAHVRMAEESVLPLASHLQQVQDTPAEVLAGRRTTA
ncbi:MAG: hypothetical protein PHS73_02860 [Candidatus Peribacteraceae bacterium]|nr:hypothetical protein [Candidatus Peribacteraceae bacterium]